MQNPQKTQQKAPPGMKWGLKGKKEQEKLCDGYFCFCILTCIIIPNFPTFQDAISLPLPNRVRRLEECSLKKVLQEVSVLGDAIIAEALGTGPKEPYAH